MGRVRHRDHAAFAVLVGRHLNGIHAFCHRFTGNRDDAADLAQETFLRIWSKAGTWRPGRVKFTTWAYRIARNQCIDAKRRRRDTEPLDDEAIATDGASAAEPGLGSAMHAALGALPERQRTALLLCHAQGFSNRDAAQVLAVSVDALESLLARARRSLKAALEGCR